MTKQIETLLDFDGLASRMQQAREDARANRPVILGGRFEHSRLSVFLDKWRGQWGKMPWRIWEYVSSIGFVEKPENTQWLQRAEIFGEGGHLSLRRDGERWLWHFIGAARPTLSDEFKRTDFWDKHPETVLHRYAESVILWGEEVLEDRADPQTGIGRWQDDRVGAALLEYPQMKGTSRVYLHYWRYSQAGETQFVWYRGLGNEQEVAKWPKAQ